MKKTVTLLCLLLSNAIYAADGDTVIVAYCARQKAYIDRPDEVSVTSEHTYAIKNETDQHQYFNSKLTVCIEGGRCKVMEFKNLHQNPHGYYVSPQYNLYTTKLIRQSGVHRFRVTTDITGYKTLHAEKTCELVVKKI